MKRKVLSEAAILHKHAEELLSAMATPSIDQLTEAEILNFFHELQVHRIELEMQNQELVLAKEQSLNASAKYIDLYDFAPIGYFTLSKEGKILEINLSGAEMLGKNRAAIRNRLFGLYVSGISKSEYNDFLKRTFECKDKQTCELALSTIGNNLRYVHITGIINENGDQCFVAATDITELKKAEETIKRNETILRIFIEHSPAAIAMFDLDMKYIATSRRFLIDYDLDGQNVIGRAHYEIFPEIPQRWKDIHHRCLSGMTEHCEEDPFIRADGKSDWVRWEICPWYEAHGKIGGIILFSEVITERKLADEEIRKSKEQLVQLYKHLNDVREEERTSIAREIHDELGQSLAGLKIDLIAMKEALNDRVSTNHRIDKAISLVDGTIKTVQKLTSELRPQMLDELGLASAIEWQTGEFKKRTGIKCKLNLQDIDDLAQNVAISLFRIFQTSMTNIMLHSKATSIMVKLKKIKGAVQLRIIDNGRGITLDQLNSPKSFGIIGMRERTNQINGKIEILTQENIGTEIIVTVPLMLNKAIENPPIPNK